MITFKTPGKLEKTYKVICGGGCKTALDTDYQEKHYAEDKLRRLGWSETVKRGWVCPECKAKK